MFTPNFTTNKGESKTLFSTAAAELKKQDIVRFPTGCKSLDNLLDGGIEAGVITQVYGPPGSGKTQLCHTLSVMLAPDYEVIYIDTEGGFRPERIQEIANARGFDSKQILQRILVTKALDSKQQESRIEAACSKIDSDNKIKLLIVDSLIYHYRAECAGRSKLPEKIQRLNKYMHLLLKTTHTSGVTVVVTNHQTQSSVDGTYNRVVPLGGNAVSYPSKYRVHLGCRGGYRCARLDLGPCPPQDDISFAINERGFTDIAED
ncbi:MAG: ATPase domain-containing protein [Candidatus Nitrosopolaris sp.]